MTGPEGGRLLVRCIGIDMAVDGGGGQHQIERHQGHEAKRLARSSEVVTDPLGGGATAEVEIDRSRKAERSAGGGGCSWMRPIGSRRWSSRRAMLEEPSAEDLRAERLVGRRLGGGRGRKANRSVGGVFPDVGKNWKWRRRWRGQRRGSSVEAVRWLGRAHGCSTGDAQRWEVRRQPGVGPMVVEKPALGWLPRAIDGWRGRLLEFGGGGV